MKSKKKGRRTEEKGKRDFPLKNGTNVSDIQRAKSRCKMSKSPLKNGTNAACIPSCDSLISYFIELAEQVADSKG